MKSEMLSNRISFGVLVVFLAILPKGLAWGWFSSTSSSDSGKSFSTSENALNGLVAQFSIESLEDPRAKELLEKAKRKLGGTNPCWLKAYQTLFSSCSEIFAAEEKRSRLAWDLSVCFQIDTARSPFPSCDEEATMIDCLRKLDNHEHKTYLEFYLETNSICHQLQSKAFRIQVENLVNELKESAQFAEDKLGSIEETSNHLLQSSNQLQDSLTSIDLQTHHVSDSLRNMIGNVNSILTHSKDLKEQAEGIASSQSELLDGQGKMREKLEEDMGRVMDSYNELGREIDNLQVKSVEIEKEINKYGEAMFAKMNTLQGKADDIDSKAEYSLDKQQALLDGQVKAFEGLQLMTRFQSQALEESRNTLQGIQEFAQGQHEKLLLQQDQLLQVHEHLAEKSRTILAAQEAFESKQTSMLMAIDRLFALQNAMLVESRIIKVFFVYCIIIFLVYIFTGAKQTHSTRFILYIGLSISFSLEFATLRFTSYDGVQQARLINVVRLCYVTFAAVQLLYSYFTFRDYEAMNHKMLVSLMEKVNGMVTKDEHDSDEDSDVDWPSWIDTELSGNVDSNVDPDYRLPEKAGELMVVSSAGKGYSLRRRR